MGIAGSYLTLQVDGAVVAETTDVSLKAKAKALDATSADSGGVRQALGGLVKIAAAGTYLVATDASNWDTLWSAFDTGDEVTVGYYLNGSLLFSGYGQIRKLTLRGGDSRQRVTGTYGIVYKAETSVEDVQAILTEDGFDFITEDGETIILE